MDLTLKYIFSFLFGVLFSSAFFILLLSKLKNIISNDFVKIANDTIKNEQEDLRKQNREALEEKILPLSRQINEFKDKVDKFNI